MKKNRTGGRERKTEAKKEIKRREKDHKFFESRKGHQDNVLGEIIGVTFRMIRNT